MPVDLLLFSLTKLLDSCYTLQKKPLGLVKLPHGQKSVAAMRSDIVDVFVLTTVDALAGLSVLHVAVKLGSVDWQEDLALKREYRL